MVTVSMPPRALMASSSVVLKVMGSAAANRDRAAGGVQGHADRFTRRGALDEQLIAGGRRGRIADDGDRHRQWRRRRA